jgi:Tol biopolymer transport system component/predicted Ser/Thr protein kinase
MDAERWGKIDRLFDEAIERSPETRADFLIHACEGDEELRREVQSLLDAHANSASFLSTLALDVVARQIVSEKQPSLIGKQLGAYQVIEVLGIGGMGEVYLARDERLNRKLALKLLPRHFTRVTDRVRRFEREARAASALNHPNIITIYDIGEIAGIYFIAAEYVEGQTLRQLIERSALQVKDAIAICLQIAGALDAAHEAGLVHRDIKPENVMVRPDGYVKVLDFGLVKLTEPGVLEQQPDPHDPHKTSPGTVMGTIAYMSPEQASGIEVDHRSDIFSLGVLMYELLTGVLPFKGVSTASTLDAIIYHQPATLTSINKETNMEMERIVSRALEKDRNFRYQTAGDFRAELKGLQRELDSVSRRSDVGSSLAAENKPSGLMIQKPVFALAAILVLVVLVFAWMLGKAQKSEPSPWLAARISQITDFPHEEFFPSLSPDGNTLVYARRSGGDWDIFAQRVGGFNTQSLTENYSGDDTQPAFSPDGAYIAFRSERDGGGIFVMGASGESVRRLSDRGAAYDPAWSPDNLEVIYTEERFRDPRDRMVSPHRLWAVNLKTLEKRIITTKDVVQPQWSPSGHRIAYWASDESSQRDIWTMNPQGEAAVRVTNDAATDWNPVWSPDGKYLYFVSDRSGRMQLWRISIDEPSGRPLSPPELVPTPSALSQHISLSRDGKRLAFVNASVKRNLYRVEVDPQNERITGQPKALTQWSRQGMDLDISADGKHLAYTTVADSQEDIALLNSDGSGEPRWLTDDEYRDRGPRWSPDGKRLAFYSTRSGNFEIWLINADGTGLRRLTESGNDRAFTPLWSPDGKRLSYTNNRGETRIIEVDKPSSEQTPQKLNPERNPPLQFWPAAWSPDGRRLIGRSNLEGQALVPVTYLFETGKFEKLSDTGSPSMAWFQDNRRTLFMIEGAVFLTDTETKKSCSFFSITPDRIIGFRLSRDNRWLYYILESIESDVWLLQYK